VLQIVSDTSRQGQAVLALHGRLAGVDVGVLDRELETRLGEGASVVLDLDGVSFIDRQGSESLRHWAAAGLTLRGGTPFLRLLLRQRGVTCLSPATDEPHREDVS
jgi:anti-anti-sigma regulatory factor